MLNIKDVLSYRLKFTWSNKRHGAGFTKEKLDRVMANSEGLVVLPDSTCNVLPAVKSDHSPLLINLAHSTHQFTRKHPIFCYKAAWELKDECTRVTKKAWTSQTQMDFSRYVSKLGIHHRLQKCQTAFCLLIVYSCRA